MAVGSQKDARVSSLSLAGCWAVTGPGAVRGPPGGSVAVRCRYRGGSEDDPKFWCREAGVWVGGSWRCSEGRHIVETNGSEAEVRRGRVSIRDSHTELAFTVTVENLTRADAGTYHCGVGKVWRSDPRAAVELTVSTGKSRRCRARGTAGGRWKGGGCLHRQICCNPGSPQRPLLRADRPLPSPAAPAPDSG